MRRAPVHDKRSNTHNNAINIATLRASLGDLRPTRLHAVYISIEPMPHRLHTKARGENGSKEGVGWVGVVSVSACVCVSVCVHSPYMRMHTTGVLYGTKLRTTILLFQVIYVTTWPPWRFPSMGSCVQNRWYSFDYKMHAFKWNVPNSIQQLMVKLQLEFQLMLKLHIPNGSFNSWQSSNFDSTT